MSIRDVSFWLSARLFQNALLSAVPFFLNWIFSIVYSGSLDKAIAKEKITRTNARKLSQWIGEQTPIFWYLTIYNFVFKFPTIIAQLLVLEIGTRTTTYSSIQRILIGKIAYYFKWRVKWCKIAIHVVRFTSCLKGKR